MKDAQIAFFPEPEADIPAPIDELASQVTKLRNSLTTDRMDMSFGEIMSMYL